LADLTAGVELITEQAKRAPAEADAQASTVAGGGREKDPDWTAKMFRVDETNLIDPKELASAQATMSASQYLSFD